MLRPALLGAGAAALVLLVGVGMAWAHANLERATPSSNAVLDRSPPLVQIWFTEEPEPRFSEIAVYDAQGRRVDTARLRTVPGEARSLIADLPALANGPYTVAWKTLSAVDGHTATGAYTFAVGLGEQPGLPVVPTGGAPARDPVLEASQAFVRWWSYLSMGVLAGGLAFVALVMHPSARDRPGIGALARRILRIAAGCAIAATVATLPFQAASASGLPVVEAVGNPLADLLQTRFGLLWGARLGLIVVLLLLVMRRRAPGVMGPAGLAVAACLLATISLGSHAAAQPSGAAVAIVMDWLHLVGTSVWIGGLVMLTVIASTLARRGDHGWTALLGGLVARFSPLALASVVALIVSGTYQAWLHVGSVDALLATPYGQTLLWKLALVVPMLGVGLVNAVWLRPGLMTKPERSRTATAAWFRRAVTAEAGLGVVVLGVVGYLTLQEPARDALARAPASFAASQRADDLQIQLLVAPAVAGWNEIEVRLTDGRGRPAEAQRVTLRLTHREHLMGENEVVLEPRGDGRWGARGSYLSMVGNWNVGVLVRRDGRDDARADIVVPLADQGGPTEHPGHSGGGHR